MENYQCSECGDYTEEIYELLPTGKQYCIDCIKEIPIDDGETYVIASIDIPAVNETTI